MTDLSWPWTRPRRVEPVDAEAARHRWTTAVLYSSVFAWALGFSILAADRHREFVSHRYDLGNVVQAIWSTAHGRFLENTATDGTQMSRLGSHVDPFLALFAPLWWVWPSPEMITTLQAVALSAGALPVFWLARKHTGDPRAALCLALAYLLLPAVQWNALDDIHAVTFAVPLLLYCLWFLDEDRPVAGVLFGVLAASTKEDIPLVLAGIAVWYAFRHRRWILASTLAALSLAWAAVALWVVIPHFSGDVSPFYRRLDSVGGSPGGVVTKLVTDPSSIWHAATTGADVRYVAALMLPLLLLPLLEPLLALAALPVLALSLLSDFEPMTSVRFHYAPPRSRALVAAAAIGTRRLPRRAGTLALVGVSRGRGDRDVRRAAAYGRELRADEDAFCGGGGRDASGDGARPGRRGGECLQPDRRAPLGAPAHLQLPRSRPGGLGYRRPGRSDHRGGDAIQLQGGRRRDPGRSRVDPLFDEGGVHVLRSRADDA